ncbi:putative protein C3P1 [Theropithecus gelada]|uniref:putative protein C3P1 n=1 Tax=Theropithecus gelada TaxID=9565 RepID=UPI000DC17048|nr:putative protein C3P1 [Theropithecus gelada]
MPARTLFPESWLWRKFTLPKSESGISHYPISVNVPDSITTWQFVAVSLKAGQGLCVSDPFELTVMKSFFVDLKLPSSVVRNEQVQIQAVLYNFRDRQAKVRVEFPHKEPLCSASKPGAPSRQAGGQIQQTSYSIVLEPQGQTQTKLVPRQEFLNMVPDTEAEVFISVQGDILGETIVGSLTPNEIRHLLRVPTGCPEQTLSSLTPVIILSRYLDATRQWGKVGVEHRDQVMKNIVSGESWDPPGASMRILTMYHKSPESWEDNCNLYHLNVTLHSVLEDDRQALPQLTCSVTQMPGAGSKP